MRHLFYLMVLALCVMQSALVLSQLGEEYKPPLTSITDMSARNQQLLKRMVRDSNDEPVPPFSTDKGSTESDTLTLMKEGSATRKRRSAKGGGSMPTRKG